MRLRVTGLERTVVDALDRPALCGGWEETWNSLGSLDAYLDLDLLIDYALRLANATTAAKVGYFLETYQDRLRVDPHSLDRLRGRRPRQAHYLQRDRDQSAGGTPSRFVREWNLMVPALAGDLDGEATRA